jgi:hypothetical protein
MLIHKSGDGRYPLQAKFRLKERDSGLKLGLFLARHPSQGQPDFAPLFQRSPGVTVIEKGIPVFPCLFMNEYFPYSASGGIDINFGIETWHRDLA